MTEREPVRPVKPLDMRDLARRAPQIAMALDAGLAELERQGALQAACRNCCNYSRKGATVCAHCGAKL